MSTRTSHSLQAKEEAVGAKIVLIVSGQPEFLDHYRDLFLEWGFTPLTTTSSIGALACLRLVVLEVMIMDQSLNTSEGQEILGRARTMKECPPIIVVGSPGRSDFCRAQDMPATVEFVHEPLSIPDVLRVIASRGQARGAHNVNN